MVLKVRIMITLEGVVSGRGHQGVFWCARNVLLVGVSNVFPL